MKSIVRLIALALFSTLALAASVPYTFSAGAPAVAAEVNANFSALADAITALEAKVAALESGGKLTAADVAGTYRRISMTSKTVGGDSTSLEFGSSSGVTEADVVISPGGTFTIKGTEKQAEFSAKTTQCNTPSSNNATSSSGPSTTGAAGSHFHLYTYAACTSGGFVSTNPATNDPFSNGGTWAITGPDSITLTPTGQAAITVYISKAGRVGYAVEVESRTNATSSGRRFEMSVLFKRS